VAGDTLGIVINHPFTVRVAKPSACLTSDCIAALAAALVRSTIIWKGGGETWEIKIDRYSTEMEE